jgi:hypothetical protein
MTEADWLACSDPRALMIFLGEKAGDRKLRLFAVACCRRIWFLFREQRVRDAVDLAERFADGLTGDEERSAARKAAQQAAQGRGVTTRPTAPKAERRAAAAVYWAAARLAGEAATHAPDLAIEAIIWQAGGPDRCDWQAIKASERTSQARAFRDIFGNPFRVPALDPDWLQWNDGTVAKIAQAINDERDFERMPILADALEDAGCADVDILDHCRSAWTHVRGCWVIDLLLGKV